MPVLGRRRTIARATIAAKNAKARRRLGAKVRALAVGEKVMARRKGRKILAALAVGRAVGARRKGRKTAARRIAVARRLRAA